MKQWTLTLDWHYNYDKEGSWSDDEDGTTTFVIEEGAEYPVPNMSNKKMLLHSVKEEDGVLSLQIDVDSHRYTVRSDEPSSVVGHCGYSYSVAGDCVNISLNFKMRIE